MHLMIFYHFLIENIRRLNFTFAVFNFVSNKTLVFSSRILIYRFFEKDIHIFDEIFLIPDLIELSAPRI